MKKYIKPEEYKYIDNFRQFIDKTALPINVSIEYKIVLSVNTDNLNDKLETIIKMLSIFDEWKDFIDKFYGRYLWESSINQLQHK